MSIYQIYWAMSHDWYNYTATCSVTGARTVHCQDSDGERFDFTSFKDLQIWAGY